MFIGEYKHNLDVKGRLAIPAKFRQVLTHGAVVTKGLDDCLFLYPKEEWDKLASKVANLSLYKANHRAFARFMLAPAMSLEIDAQGRVVVPEYLRKYAGIEKKVIIAGLYDHLEIWNETKWEKYKQGVDTKSTDIAETLNDNGLLS